MKLKYIKSEVKVDSCLFDKNMKKKFKGFTLIELLAVILILALIFIFVIFSFGSVFSGVNDKISKTEKKVILTAAKNYALEYRGSDTWVEEIDKNTGNVSFCVSLESLINYGYFKNDGNNFEKYKNSHVVEFTIINGVYDYELKDIDESENCKRFDFTSGIPDGNNNIVTEINNGVDNVGDFTYHVQFVRGHFIF